MPITSELQILSVSCQGGLVLDRDILSIPAGAATILSNYEPDTEGGYRRITGYSEYSASALSGTGDVLGIAVLGSNVIGCRGANVEKGSGSTWTLIDSSRTSAGRYIFDKFDWTGTEKLIMADGVNPAATYDNTTYTLINGTGAPASPSFVQEFKNHMWYIQGNEILFSVPYDETNFSVAGGAGSITFTEGPIAAREHRDALYIFTPKSIFKITGTNQADWAVEPVSRGIGCVSKHSIQEISSDLVFLAPDGLRTIASTDKIGDTELGTISKQIQSIMDNIEDSGDNISSLVIRSKTQYRMWYHADSEAEESSKGIITVLKRQVTPNSVTLTGETAWEFAETVGIKPSCSTNDVLGTNTLTDIELHGDSTGIIYKQENGNTFNGTSISAVFSSPDLPLTDIGIRDTLQRLILDMQNDAATTVTIDTVLDANSTATPQPASFTISEAGSGAVYGTGTYGTSSYAVLTIVINRSPLVGSGFTVAIKISEEGTTTSPFSVKGFSIEFTPGGRR
jgi:hypothetical protein